MAAVSLVFPNSIAIKKDGPRRSADQYAIFQDGWYAVDHQISGILIPDSLSYNLRQTKPRSAGLFFYLIFLGFLEIHKKHFEVRPLPRSLKAGLNNRKEVIRCRVILV